MKYRFYNIAILASKEPLTIQESKIDYAIGQDLLGSVPYIFGQGNWSKEDIRDSLLIAFEKELDNVMVRLENQGFLKTDMCEQELNELAHESYQI